MGISADANVFAKTYSENITSQGNVRKVHSMPLRKSFTQIFATLLFAGLVGKNVIAQSNDKQSTTALIQEKEEGEHRVHRLAGNKMGTTPFTLKVDPKNTGSQQLVLFTEDLAPGASIPMHKHPNAEEILVLQTGNSRVHLGQIVKDGGPGATIFIPMDTWISVENVGTEPVSLIAIFSEPGYEEYMRAISVREGENNTPLSKAELDVIRRQHPHSVTYK
jgi:quercetin dioxygenase-like cupin family protein